MSRFLGYFLLLRFSPHAAPLNLSCQQRKSLPIIVRLHSRSMDPDNPHLLYYLIDPPARPSHLRPRHMEARCPYGPSSWVPQPQAASCMLQATFDKQECGGSGGAARRETGHG
ncbi:hypothetical protein QBC45DRAFT_399842 [Copromyces sp. CBS 386.78]|nr:hypothetical protein QBC45DRAFT_399842 [Copromyces sp. CBS 386.78]